MVQRNRICGFFALRHYDDEILSSLGSATGTARTRHAFHFLSSRNVRHSGKRLALYNAAFLGVFWPFFIGIAFQVITALFQFARMILLLPE